MRLLQLGGFTLAVCLLTANGTEANGLFRHCRTCQTGSPGARNIEATPPKAENIQASPPAALTTPLAISSSGLESEVLKRAADWTSIGKGVTSTTTSAGGETKTVTVTVGDQTIEITIRVGGSGTSGGQEPTDDLTKSLLAAFNADTVLKGSNKEAVRDNLAKVYLTLAAKLRGSDPIVLGTDTITKKEGVHRLLKALLDTNVGGNLPKTRGEIDRLVVNALALKNDMTALTPPIQAELATKFEGVAAALKGVKLGGGKSGGQVPPADLTKSLQIAFATDTVLTGSNKGTVKDNLAKVYSTLATRLRASDPIVLGTDTITKKEGVHRLLKALIDTSVGGNLPNTRGEIDRLVVNALALKNDSSALTPQIRADLATQFENIAAALNTVK